MKLLRGMWVGFLWLGPGTTLPLIAWWCFDTRFPTERPVLLALASLTLEEWSTAPVVRPIASLLQDPASPVEKGG